VDDLHISCEGADMRYIERQLQAAVGKIMKWSEMNGFTISRSKTYGVHFCRKRGLHPEPEIHLAGDKINFVDAVKILGVTFDRKLTFLPHIMHLRKKCESSLNILKVLASTSWGADRTCLLKVYHSLILSKLDYGCEVYSSARKSILNKLSPIQHSALRLCSGAFRTSPVDSLYADCCEEPLELRRKVLSLNYFFRTSSFINHPVHNHSISPYLIRLYNNRPSQTPPFNLRVKQILESFSCDNVDILTVNDFNPPWKTHNFKF
jgi:hypothetical protein